MIKELKQAAKAMNESPIAKEGRMYYTDDKVYQVENKPITLGSLFPFNNKPKEVLK